MKAAELREAVEERARRLLGAPLDAAALARLERHFALLQLWNRAVGLISVRGLEEATGLYTEPLQVLDQFPEGSDALLVDLGSGGGFPGLILAVLRPRWRVVLVERSARKAAFLAEAVRELHLEQVQVLERDLRGPADLPAGLRPDRMTLKALAEFSLVLDLLQERGAAGARCILFTGHRGCGEVEREVARRAEAPLLVERRPLEGRRRSYALILARSV